MEANGRKVKTMFKKIIDIYKEYKTENLPLFRAFANVDYPEIEDNESNFCEDYLQSFAAYDNYIARMWGQRNFDAFLSSTHSEALAEYDEAVEASLTIHIKEWARLYYALSIKYNPLWNVDGTTKTIYGEKERHDDIAQHIITNQEGSGHVETKGYSVAYDSAIEKETGKEVTDSQTRTDTRTENPFLDKIKELEHTDTEIRSGNIGVTMSQQLLNAEYELRKKSFFRTIFKTIIDDIGCYYIEGEWR